MQVLGAIDANDQLIEADLDGATYYVGLSWNEEGQLWSLSLRDLDEVLLVSGIAVVPNGRLLRQVRRASFPKGDIVAATALGKPLDRQSFISGAAVLAYLSVDELI